MGSPAESTLPMGKRERTEGVPKMDSTARLENAAMPELSHALAITETAKNSNCLAVRAIYVRKSREKLRIGYRKLYICLARMCLQHGH